MSEADPQKGSLRDADIFVAACDLDKTVYPPAGPLQLRQLRANVVAMQRFEESGGLALPVTGNNLVQAQVKFVDEGGEVLRELRDKPGIFMNGGLVLGPGGVEIERHALGHLQLRGGAQVDFATALLDFWDDERHIELTRGVGLLFFLPEELLGYAGASANVEAFCASQRVPCRLLARNELLEQRERTLLILALFPREAEGGGGELDYERELRPWQLRVKQALDAHGLTECKTTAPDAPLGVGDGVRLTLQGQPWPEIDFNVAGVDKGSALARFLRAPAVREHFALPHGSSVKPATHVAVFGDATNDVPMFEAIGGECPALRVVMPHATDATLNALATERAEVSEVLLRLSAARVRAAAARSAA